MCNHDETGLGARPKHSVPKSVCQSVSRAVTGRERGNYRHPPQLPVPSAAVASSSSSSSSSSCQQQLPATAPLLTELEAESSDEQEALVESLLHQLTLMCTDAFRATI